METIDGAGVALVSALVLNVHLRQLEGGVSSGDLVLKQRRPASEALVLEWELVLFVVVGVDTKVSFLQPADDHISIALEAARQDASLHENTGDLSVCNTSSTGKSSLLSSQGFQRPDVWPRGCPSLGLRLARNPRTTGVFQ